MRLQLARPFFAALLALLPAASAMADDAIKVSSRIDVYSDEWLTVVSPATSLAAPVAEALEVEARYAFDALSGATHAMPADAISSATQVSEARHQLDLATTWSPSELQTLSAFYLTSFEPDSATHVFGFSGAREILERMSTVRLGYRIELGSVGTVFDDKRDKYTGHIVDLGWHQIIDAQTTVEVMTTAEAVRCDESLGCNASPYRFVAIYQDASSATPLLAASERHPASRYRAAGSVRLARYLAPGLGAHAFYRAYTDSWRITGHTAELVVVKSLLAERLVLRADVRGTHQSAAQFYDGRYDRGGAPPMVPSVRTADREMAGLDHGAVSARVEWNEGSLLGLEDVGLSARLSRLWYRYDDVKAFPHRSAWLIGGGLHASF